MPTEQRIEETIHLGHPVRCILPILSSDHTIWSISPEATVADAIEQMTERHIGALVVLSAQKLDGIITEEDVREAPLRGTDGEETKVSEFMTRGVYYANPEMTIEQCILLMTSKRLRHLPVVEGAGVLSMLSIEALLEFSANSGRIRESQPSSARN